MGASREPRGRAARPLGAAPCPRRSRLRPTEVAARAGCSLGGQGVFPGCPQPALCLGVSSPGLSPAPELESQCLSNPNLKLGLRPGDRSDWFPWLQVSGLLPTQVSQRRTAESPYEHLSLIGKNFEPAAKQGHPGKMVDKKKINSLTPHHKYETSFGRFPAVIGSETS